MPRKPKDPSDPDKLQHYVPVHFNAADLDVINRVASFYGMSKSAAVRLMMREGAKQYDPFAPEQGSDET